MSAPSLPLPSLSPEEAAPLAPLPPPDSELKQAKKALSKLLAESGLQGIALRNAILAIHPQPVPWNRLLMDWMDEHARTFLLETMATTTNIAAHQQQAARYFQISEATYLFWIHLFSVHKCIQSTLKTKKDMDPHLRHEYKAFEQALLYWLNLNKSMAKDTRMGTVKHKSLMASQHAFELNMQETITIPTPEHLVEKTFIRAKQNSMTELYMRQIPNTLETNLIDMTRFIFYSPVENRMLTYWIWIALAFAELHGMNLLTLRLQKSLAKTRSAYMFSMPCLCVLPFFRRSLTYRLVAGFLDQTVVECPFPFQVQLPEELKQTEFMFPELVSRSPLVRGQNTLISNMFYSSIATLQVVPPPVAAPVTTTTPALLCQDPPAPSSTIHIKGDVKRTRRKQSELEQQPLAKRTRATRDEGLQLLNVAIAAPPLDWYKFRWDHYPDDATHRRDLLWYARSTEFKQKFQPYIERLGNPQLSGAETGRLLIRRLKMYFFYPGRISAMKSTSNVLADLPVLCSGQLYRDAVAAGEKDLCRPRLVKDWFILWERLHIPDDRGAPEEELSSEDEEIMDDQPLEVKVDTLQLVRSTPPMNMPSPSHPFSPSKDEGDRDWMEFRYDYYPEYFDEKEVKTIRWYFALSPLYKESLNKWVPLLQRQALGSALFQAFNLWPGKFPALAEKYPHHIVMCRGLFYDRAKKAGEKDLCRPRPLSEWAKVYDTIMMKSPVVH